MFGIKGLNIKSLTGAISKDVKTGELSAAFSGRASLPNNWVGPTLGINKAATVTFAYNNGGLRSCARFGITKPTSAKGPTLDLFKVGIVKANKLDVAIAPSGCVIGDIKVGPGLNLAFDGKVGGTTAKIAAKITPQALGYEMAAKVTLDSFNIVGLADFKSVKMNLAKSKYTNLTVDFVGTATFFGSKMAVAANLTNDAIGLKPGTAKQVRFGFVADFAPTIAGLPLGGLHAEFKAVVSNDKVGKVTINANVNLPLFGSGTSTKSKLIVSPLTCGTRATGKCLTGLKPLTYKPTITTTNSKKNSASGDVRIRIVNGVLAQFSGSASLSLDILGSDLSGDVRWKWNGKADVSLGFKGKINLFGATKKTVKGSIGSSGFSFETSLYKRHGFNLTVLNIGVSGFITIDIDVTVGYNGKKPKLSFDGTLKAKGCVHYLLGKECGSVNGSLNSNGIFKASLSGKKIKVDISELL